jgi:hypothetical protein
MDPADTPDLLAANLAAYNAATADMLTENYRAAFSAVLDLLSVKTYVLNPDYVGVHILNFALTLLVVADTLSHYELGLEAAANIDAADRLYAQTRQWHAATGGTGPLWAAFTAYQVATGKRAAANEL